MAFINASVDGGNSVSFSYYNSDRGSLGDGNPGGPGDGRPW